MCRRRWQQAWPVLGGGDYVLSISLFAPPYTYVGLARTIYTRCMYCIFGREITKYTVIYGANLRFWPALHICVRRRRRKRRRRLPWPMPGRRGSSIACFIRFLITARMVHRRRRQLPWPMQGKQGFSLACFVICPISRICTQEEEAAAVANAREARISSCLIRYMPHLAYLYAGGGGSFRGPCQGGIYGQAAFQEEDTQG
jgi:hypothetical protein